MQLTLTCLFLHVSPYAACIEDEVVPDKVTTVHAAPNLLRALDPDADWSDDEDGKEKSKIPKRGKKRLEWRVAAIIASFEKVGRPELIITVIDIILMFIVFFLIEESISSAYIFA